MSKIQRLMALLAVTFVATACAPEERMDDELGMDRPVSQELSEQLAAFRMEVESNMSLLVSEIQGMQQELREDQRERWEELSSRVEQTEEAVRSSLERLDALSTGEAQAARSEASQQIARLEAEVTLAELELASNRQELLDRATEQLRRLEMDVDEIAQRIAEHETAAGPYGTPPEVAAEPQPGPDAPIAAPMAATPQTADAQLDWDKLDQLYRELAELREEIARLQSLPAEDSEVAEVADALPETVAELTRDVRGAWYDSRWMGDDAV